MNELIIEVNSKNKTGFGFRVYTETYDQMEIMDKIKTALRNNGKERNKIIDKCIEVVKKQLDGSIKQGTPKDLEEFLDGARSNMKLIVQDLQALKGGQVDLLVIPQFTYLRTPLNKYTFTMPKIREWVESVAEGYTLNLFAGKTKLNINEFRNDIRPEMEADSNLDALEFCKTYKGQKFNTVLLDPPYSYRKSMEMYEGKIASPFNQLKDAILEILEPNGIVITFGYHSVSMGKIRNFKVEQILLMSHGGAIHDTIATLERCIAV